jgi:tape measure domain-containing protein
MRKLNKSLYASQAENRKTLDRIQRDTEAASKRMFAPIGEGFRREIASLSGLLAGLFTTQQVARYADQYTSLQNRLKAAGLEGENLKRVEDALYETANRNGLQVQATAELYQRASLSRQRLGASEEQLLALVSGTAAALKVQGTSAEAASGPLLQLGQVLGGTKVQAEEYNSLIDGLPVLLQAAANGSKRFGGDVAKLTELVKAGKVTSQEFFQALLIGFRETEKQASDAAATIGSALQTLDNAFGRFIGQTDEGLSASQRLAQGIVLLSENLDKVAGAITVVAALLAGNLAGRGVAAAIAALISLQTQMVLTNAQLTAFELRAGLATGALGRMTAATGAATAATRGFAGAVAFLGGPIGALITAVAALSVGIVLLGDRMRAAGEASRDVKTANDALSAATDAYTQAANAAAAASGKEAKVARDNAAAKREQAIATRNAAQAKLADAAATVAQIQAAAQRQLDLERRAPIRGDRPGSVRTIGQAERQRLADAQASAQAAQAAITSANAAISQADAILKRAPANGGGGGGGGAGGRTGGRGSSSGDRIADLRERLTLEEDIARVRATGDEAAIKREEERQRIIEATERYREAGYADAEQRALNLIAAENQAEDIAEQRERTQARIREGIEREAELKRAATDWTERQYSAELEIARLRGDESAIRRLEREADLRRRIAEYVERFGVAGVGMAVAEQLSFDQAAAEGDLNYAAENAARTFVDVIAADDPWSAAGDAFKRAAFENLESLFSNIFKSLMNNKDGGGLLGSIASGIGSLFGGGARATGGPVTAGRAYKINHNNPQSEWFVPGMNGSVLTNGQMRGLQTGSVRTSGGVLAVTVDVSGANGDAAVAAIAEAAARRGAEAAVAQSRADQAQANAAKRYRLK